MDALAAAAGAAAAEAEAHPPPQEEAVPLLDRKDLLVEGKRTRKLVARAGFVALKDDAVYEDVEDDELDGRDDYGDDSGGGAADDSDSDGGPRRTTAATLAALRAKRVRVAWPAGHARRATLANGANPFGCGTAEAADAPRRAQAKKETLLTAMESDVARGVGFDPYSIRRGVQAAPSCVRSAPAAALTRSRARRAAPRGGAGVPVRGGRRRGRGLRVPPPRTRVVRTHTAAPAAACVTRATRAVSHPPGAGQVARGRVAAAERGERAHTHRRKAPQARHGELPLPAPVRAAPCMRRTVYERTAECAPRVCVRSRRHGYINFGVVARPPPAGPSSTKGTILILGAGLAGLAAARQLMVRRPIRARVQLK